MTDALFGQSSAITEMVAGAIDAMVFEVLTRHRWSTDDARQFLEIREYKKADSTLVVVHDRWGARDLYPRLRHGFDGLTYRVWREE